MKKKDNVQVLFDRALLFPKAVSNPQIIIDLVSESSWTPNLNTNWEGKPVRFETNLYLDKNTSYGNEILSEIEQVLREIRKSVGTSPDHEYAKLNSFNFDVSKNIVNGYVGTHTDDDITEDDGTYTAILYLNDIYEGGELGFPEVPLELKLNAGDIIVFPAFYPHYSNKILSGEKYISIFKIFPTEE